MDKLVTYYRRWGGIDARDTFSSLQGLKFLTAHESDDNFEYFNVCVILEDGSEEIAFTNIKELMEAK